MVKIIKKEVIGSSNPVARWARGLGESIKGIFAGFLLILISFAVIYAFTHQVKHSETIAALPLQTAEEVQGYDGMVKIQGEPEYSNIVVTTLGDTEALYYSYLEESYAVREVSKTRTVTEDGQDIKETYVEYEAAWETTEAYEKWSSFSLGPIQIYTDDINTQFNTTTFYDATEDQEYDKTNYMGTKYTNEELVNVVQKIRYTITGVAAEGQELIVVGSVSGDTIASGEQGTFFVSNMTDAAFQEAQAKSEQRSFWIMVVAAWILMTAGFTMFFGPITHVLNILPGLGDLAKSLLGIIFGFISAAIIFTAYIGFTYWWLIALILLLLGTGLLWSKRAQKQ